MLTLHNGALNGALHNGDIAKFDQAKSEWRLKGEEEMLRFLVSVLISSEDKQTIAYKQNGVLTSFKPRSDLIDDSNGNKQ